MAVENVFYQFDTDRECIGVDEISAPKPPPYHIQDIFDGTVRHEMLVIYFSCYYRIISVVEYA